MGAVWPRPRRVVVAECDPGGNALAARFELSPLVGMTSLVLDRRRDVDDGIDAHVQRVPGGLEVLIGPASPDAARSLDHEMGDLGASVFPTDIDVIADCGRILLGSRGQAGIVKGADDVVVTVGGDAASVAHAQWMRDHIQSLTGDARVAFVLVGPCPFPIDEVRLALQADRIEQVPFDVRAAALARGLPGRLKHLERGALTRAARALADSVARDPVARRSVVATVQGTPIDQDDATDSIAVATTTGSR